MATVIKRNRRETGRDPFYVPPRGQPGPQRAVPVVTKITPQKSTHTPGLFGPTFKPWKPDLTPPLGFYDPVLDANLGAAERGYFDLGQDVDTQKGRLTSDYAIGQQRINQQADRGLEDIGVQRQQGTEDYGRAVSDLQESYRRLESTQRQRANASGLLMGGAALQAAEKRATNQAHDQAPLDTAFSRLTAGLDVQQKRLGENQQQALGDLALQQAPPDANNPFGGRAFQDLATQLARAGRENTAFGLDTSAAKAAQASAAGWNPAMTKTVRRGGMVYTIDSKGRIVAKRKAGR